MKTNKSFKMKGSLQFDLKYGDYDSADTPLHLTRKIYFDILTKGGEIYDPLDIEIYAPETELNSSILASTICKVELEAGRHTKCIQPSFINDLINSQIVYESR